MLGKLAVLILVNFSIFSFDRSIGTSTPEPKRLKSARELGRRCEPGHAAKIGEMTKKQRHFSHRWVSGFQHSHKSTGMQAVAFPGS